MNESIEECKVGFYKSNGHCCEEHFYWDNNSSRCLPLLDPNCLKSDSNLTCGTCNPGFFVEKLFTKLTNDVCLK